MDRRCCHGGERRPACCSSAPGSTSSPTSARGLLALEATAPTAPGSGERRIKDFSLKQILQDLAFHQRGLHVQFSRLWAHVTHRRKRCSRLALACVGFMCRTRGTAPALRALMAGEVQIMFVPAASAGAGCVLEGSMRWLWRTLHESACCPIHRPCANWVC